MPAVAAPPAPLAPLARVIADTVQDVLPDLDTEQQALLITRLLFNLTDQPTAPTSRSTR